MSEVLTDFTFKHLFIVAFEGNLARETENCELIFLKHKRKCKQVIGEKVEKIVNEVFLECDNRVCHYNDYL